MSKKKTDDSVTRRDALKGIAVGVGAAGSLPVLNTNVLGQQGHAHRGSWSDTQTGREDRTKGDGAEVLQCSSNGAYCYRVRIDNSY